MRFQTQILSSVSFLLGCGLFFSGVSTAAEPVDFDRQIRPLLSNHCFRCHGPDGGERKAKFRLDQRESATGAAESGSFPIVAGKPDDSELVRRILATDAAEIMPPPELNKPLSAADKQLLKDWVAQGAKYQQHWSFVPPVKATFPATVTQKVVSGQKWARNPVDAFVLAQLEKSKLVPSGEADKRTLIRRLALDLIGLPPAVEDVERFLADVSPDSYERAVDRLLASPFYGERMAVDWLDAARFADTHGYHIDAGRDMTRWREYVIESFNRGLPFDQFTVEQLAGDLLPNSPDEDENLRRKIASGFQRNNMINFEGGAIPQEYLNAYIVDRVNTTGMVFLGLTVGCAQCHDHKYDPITQKDFYQLYAFFNGIAESGLDGSKGNAAPLVKAPSRGETERLKDLATKIASLEKSFGESSSTVDAKQTAWEAVALKESQATWFAVSLDQVTSAGGATLQKQPDGSILATGANPGQETYVVETTLTQPQLTAVRLTVMPDDSMPSKGPGRSPNGNMVMTGVKVEIQNEGTTGNWKTAKIASAMADFSQTDHPISNTIDENPTSGWGIYPQVAKEHTAVFTLAEPVANGSSPLKLKLTFAYLSPFGQHQMGRFKVALSERAAPGLTDSLPAGVAASLAKPLAARSAAEKTALQKHYREQVSPEMRTLAAELTAARKERQQLEGSTRTVMVMQELPQPRDTFVLMRGAYDKPGDKVVADTPSFLPSLPNDQPKNRLALAKWLVAPTHPLMARVTVNRYWQLVFGTGIVKSTEDFGLQGELPSHPELLDWLAVEFQTAPSPASESWDTKRLLRLLVSSSTYRQTSQNSAAGRAHDPENRLLSRGPRHRLQAEFIRDGALLAGGLLNRKIGGNSVSPYQPIGIWEELASRADGANWTAQSYTQSKGDDLYRRTMYTFWKRTAPPPSLMTFDAPDRETCTVRRARTNTPLQALVLLNDPTYVEASRHFAERILKEGGTTLESRTQFAFQTALSRPGSAKELTIVQQLYSKQVERFAAAPAQAEKLLDVGESPHDKTLPAAELAAWTTIASSLINLDETVSKN